MRWLFFLPLFALMGCLGPCCYTEICYPPTDYREIVVVNLHSVRWPYEILGECRESAGLGSALDLKKMASEMGADAITIPKRDTQGYLTARAIRWR
jgi:hypothetical protein